MQSAQDFVDWAQVEKQADECMVERWKSAIRWFFVTAKVQARGEAALVSPSPVESREWKVRSGVDGVNSYGGNDTSTRSGLGGASPCRVGQAPSTGSVQVGRPAIPGFSSENNTDAARIVARSEDEASILNVMWRRGMAL